MIAILRPIIFTFLQTKAVKQLVCDLLEALAAKTDNTLDDGAVLMIKNHLLK